MTARKHLQQYGEAVRRDERLKAELEMLRTHWMPLSMKTVDESENTHSLITEHVLSEMKENRNHAIALRKDIVSRLDAMKSETLRKVLYYRYICLFPWKTIATRMDYTYGYTLKIHKIALNQYPMGDKTPWVFKTFGDDGMMTPYASKVDEACKVVEKYPKKLSESVKKIDMIGYLITLQIASDATGQTLYLLYDTEDGQFEVSQKENVDAKYLVLHTIMPTVRYDDVHFYLYVFHELGFDEDIFIAQEITKDGQGNDVIQWILDHMRPADRQAIETGYYMSKCTQGYIRRRREEAEKLVRSWRVE